jgi:hypothetical protein
MIKTFCDICGEQSPDMYNMHYGISVTLENHKLTHLNKKGVKHICADCWLDVGNHEPQKLLLSKTLNLEINYKGE